MAGPERIQTRVENRQKAKEADQKLQAEFHELFSANVFDLTKETYEVASKRLTEAIQAAQDKGKTPYVKEHIVCALKPSILTELFHTGTVATPPVNPTTIADNLFDSIHQPIVQIRHPALVIPSFYRAQLVNFGNDPDEDAIGMWTVQRMTRWFFELLRSQGKKPILIDAEDVVFRSEALCRKLCDVWGIELAGVAFEWEARDAAQRTTHPFEHYVNALEKSQGVIRKEDQLRVDINAEQAMWSEEFGDEIAAALRQRVDEDMPDYVYMQQYRMILAEY